MTVLVALGVCLVAGASTGVVAIRRLRSRRRAGREREEELGAVRALAEEDVVQLGEELQRLDRRAEGHDLDEQARTDYQAALDAYEAATGAVAAMSSAEDVSRVVDAVTTGRFAVACVDARIEGRPPPRRRTLCFFNPQHGIAVTDVLWTPPGRGSRSVPACAQDAARHRAGEEPDTRTVVIGGRRVPYWEAGLLYEPYTRGYFPRTVREATLDRRAEWTLYDNPWPGDLGNPLG